MRKIEIDGKHYEQIIITKAKADPEARLVTADDRKEVLAIISDNEIVEKDGYEVKLVAGTKSAELDGQGPARQYYGDSDHGKYSNKSLKKLVDVTFHQ
ncbi:hypothetical protein GM661_00340 [Iocasia frigidifontis]|uniref:Uncharacterized protein n=1 Tax=Iocasia fonsfrigidae TaxID=2682810 RepID=A0A8A7KF71_9FIRM|nr:hypothetical protein [Iocasia fonsfrigidae]QTL96522.1 hypothetical protein GM661_00340 [Iocasia fonsfrigidae]